MAVTTYQIFIRYFNENVGKPLTNQTTVEWVGAEEWNDLEEYYNTNKTEYTKLLQAMQNGTIKTYNMTTVQLNMYTECTRYLELLQHINDDDGKVVLENVTIRSYDSGTTAQLKKAAKQLDMEMYQTVIDETYASNPKYDMIFMYDGIGNVVFPGYNGVASQVDKNPPSNDTKIAPEVYYERMKRIKLDPWFLHSTYHSLRAVMNRAEELVNILGVDGVKIGKVVALDQYIEIV